MNKILKTMRLSSILLAVILPCTALHAKESSLDLSKVSCFSEAVLQFTTKRQPPQLKFIGDSTLALVLQCPRDNEMHVVLISVAERKVLKEIALTADKIDVSALAPDQKGAFALVADDKLIIYSKDYEKIEEQPLSSERHVPGKEGHWRIFRDGTRILLSYFIDESETVYSLDQEFRPHALTTLRRSELLAVDDEGLLYVWFPDDLVAEKQLRFSSEGTTTTICDGHPTAAFVLSTGNQKIIVAVLRKTVDIFDLNTKKRTASIKLPGLANKAAGSQSTVLVGTNTTRTLRLTKLDLSPTQGRQMQQIADLQPWQSRQIIGKVDIHTEVQPQFALSDSGTVAAAIQGSQIIFYSWN